MFLFLFLLLHLLLLLLLILPLLLLLLLTATFDVDLGFQYDPPPFLAVSENCVPIPCYHFLQILFHLISPSILLSSSFPRSFRYGCRCFRLLFRYSSFQCVHSIVI